LHTVRERWQINSCKHSIQKNHIWLTSRNRVQKLTVCSTSQEISGILWNPKVHHSVHNRPPTVPIVSQMSPIHIPKPYFLKTHYNIILSFKPRSFKCSPPFRLCQLKFCTHSHFPHARYMSRPSTITGTGYCYEVVSYKASNALRLFSSHIWVLIIPDSSTTALWLQQTPSSEAGSWREMSMDFAD
jgi:hypothetical protein